MIDMAKTNPKWLGFAAEGYVFAGFSFWIICYAMSRYSHKFRKKNIKQIDKEFMSDAIIQMKEVNKWFGDFQVLKDINLNVSEKQKIVVCGPSGSGKSTLIRCINRLEEHQKGKLL